jgi:flavin reductase (DIM6/NTAB) family NADH-FMN oxidoreductase RutF
MRFDMRELELGARYKIVNSTITPRPIAWVTTLGTNGVVNAAPYSFFNACGVEPPMVMLGLLKDFRTGTYKDTARNVAATGEFVVNLVCEADAETMNLCSVDAPADVSEIDYAGIATLASDVVAPPRIASSPVSFECRKLEMLDIGKMQTVLIGEILVAHIADAFISDPEKLYLDTPAMELIGRTHGAGWYARTTDQFSIDRPKYDPARTKRGQD